MRRTGLPARDLRILDPMLSQPSSILGRERAIVINLEHIKAIITATEVLMINSSNPLFLQFLQDLHSHLPSSSNETPHRMSNDMDTDYGVSPTMEGPSSMRNRNNSLSNSGVRISKDSDGFSSTSNIEIEWSNPRIAEDVTPPKKIPFEFKALRHVLNLLAGTLNLRYESNSEKSFSSSGVKLDVEELDMLLEAYFAQINGILQKLSGMSEYVDDTEDCINIMLDDKRNQLLLVAVIFDTLNMMLNADIVVVGLFGMNIHIELFDGQPHQFWSTAWGTLGGCIFLFLVSVWWGKNRYLLPNS